MPREDEVFSDRTPEEAHGEGKADAEAGKTEGDNLWERAAQDLIPDILTGSDTRTDNEKSYDEGVKDGQS